MSAEIVRIHQPEAGLAVWEDKLLRLRYEIAEADTAQECLRLADAAEALLVIVKIGRALVKDQNRIARMKLDVERKAGRLLAEREKAPAGRPTGNRFHDGSNLNGDGAASYAEMAEQLGMSKAALTHKAANVQLIWTVPDEVFDKERDKLDEQGRVITSNHFIALGRKVRHDAHRRTVAGKVAAPHEDVRHGDFRKVLADLPDESVSLIFTDPPYDRKSAPLYGDLARLAARVLVDGGSLVCYAGQYVLPEVLPLMTPHVAYKWMFAIRHSGGQRRMHGFKVRVAWKPLLWFVKGRYEGDYLLDLLDSAPGDKSVHDWAQGCGEAAYLIDKLCPEGGLVLDPMCGSGTTLFAAKNLGRRWLGVEADRDHCMAASALLAGKGEHDA